MKFYFTISIVAALFISSCASRASVTYRYPDVDFGSIQTVAVLPLANFSKDPAAAERVRDVLIPMLMSSGSLYALPPGQVYLGLTKVAVLNPSAPSTEEVVKLAAFLKVNAIMTGVIREYGEVRSGSSVANVISMSLQLADSESGRVIWASSATEGGITMTDRLLGGGGVAMNKVTEKAVDDLLDQLFK